jgi:hypothetical protein
MGRKTKKDELILVTTVDDVFPLFDDLFNIYDRLFGIKEKLGKMPIYVVTGNNDKLQKDLPKIVAGMDVDDRCRRNAAKKVDKDIGYVFPLDKTLDDGTVDLQGIVVKSRFYRKKDDWFLAGFNSVIGGLLLLFSDLGILPGSRRLTMEEANDLVEAIEGDLFLLDENFKIKEKIGSKKMFDRVTGK